MADVHFWLMFLLAAIALNVAPGPDLLYVLSRATQQGKRVGIASVAGVCTGAMVHVTAAAVGLSAILVSSALAFSVVKYAGAAYLLYLAYKAFRSGGFTLDMAGLKVPEISAFQAFKQGVLIDIFNPKAAIFFMAFLPQFVRPDAGPVPLQLFGLGMLVIAVAFIVEGTYALLADRLASRLRKSRRFSLWLDRTIGVIFASIGIKLALSSQ